MRISLDINFNYRSQERLYLTMFEPRVLDTVNFVWEETSIALESRATAMNTVHAAIAYYFPLVLSSQDEENGQLIFEFEFAEFLCERSRSAMFSLLLIRRRAASTEATCLVTWQGHMTTPLQAVEMPINEGLSLPLQHPCRTASQHMPACPDCSFRKLAMDDKTPIADSWLLVTPIPRLQSMLLPVWITQTRSNFFQNLTVYSKSSLQKGEHCRF